MPKCKVLSFCLTQPRHTVGRFDEMEKGVEKFLSENVKECISVATSISSDATMYVTITYIPK
ncbi:MAG: hypothetical protein WC791_01510 [Candidatus Paceibacterota bacterium]